MNLRSGELRPGSSRYASWSAGATKTVAISVPVRCSHTARSASFPWSGWTLFPVVCPIQRYVLEMEQSMTRKEIILLECETIDKAMQRFTYMLMNLSSLPAILLSRIPLTRNVRRLLHHVESPHLLPLTIISTFSAFPGVPNAVFTDAKVAKRPVPFGSANDVQVDSDPADTYCERGTIRRGA